MEQEPIARAIAICGSQKALADAIGVTPANVSHWLNRVRPIPAKHCRSIQRVTGKAVSVYELCPDVFGPPPAKRKAA
jgi:DNA-binding transcriptional regulator YdaS (Cro superfamily)